MKIKYLSVKREAERLEIEWQEINTGRTRIDIVYYPDEYSAAEFENIVLRSIERRKSKEVDAVLQSPPHDVRHG